LIDVGNSRVKWALANGEGTHLAFGVFASTLEACTLPPDWLALPEPDSVWISSVASETIAQQLYGHIAAQWPHTQQHRIVEHPSQYGVSKGNCLHQALGSDRWAALIGAHAAYPDEHLLIASLGTATTVDVLNATGVFMGGLISASTALMWRALAQHTALLPLITPLDAQTPRKADEHATHPLLPYPPFAQDTRNALIEGCILTQAGFIERAWSDACTHLGNAHIRCVLTGGAAREVAPYLNIAWTHHAHLVLSGLAHIASHTHQSSQTTG